MKDSNDARELYYRMLKERWEKVDKDDLRQVKEYNDWKRELRHMLLDED